MNKEKLSILIEAVEEFPDKNFDKQAYHNGNDRCAGGVAVDTFEELEWVLCGGGVLFPKYGDSDGSQALFEFFEVDRYIDLFDCSPETKEEWLTRARAYV